jgi:hypothetical protein
VKPATALVPGWLAVAVLAGQLTGDALPQIVEMTHELGEGAGGAHGRALGADGFEQGENSNGGNCHSVPVSVPASAPARHCQLPIQADFGGPV